MSLRTIRIRTDANGAATHESAMKGTIRAIEVLLGDLSTPDIDITDGVYGDTILSVNGLAADTVYRPGIPLMDDAGSAISEDASGSGDMVGAYAPLSVMGTLKVEITGGGNNKTGRVVVLYES